MHINDLKKGYKKMVESKNYNILNIWATSIQTLILLIALTSVVVVAERRMTIVEQAGKFEREQRITAEQQLWEYLKSFQDQHLRSLETQARIVAALDQMQARHKLEDERRK